MFGKETCNRFNAETQSNLLHISTESMQKQRAIYYISQRIQCSNTYQSTAYLKRFNADTQRNLLHILTDAMQKHRAIYQISQQIKCRNTEPTLKRFNANFKTIQIPTDIVIDIYQI